VLESAKRDRQRHRRPDQYISRAPAGVFIMIILCVQLYIIILYRGIGTADIHNIYKCIIRPKGAAGRRLRDG